MNDIRQSIETAWENLLEAIQEASRGVIADALPNADVIGGKLETLHAGLRGYGVAWSDIRKLLPQDRMEDADQPDVAGTLPESAYWHPLARVLRANGGQMVARDAIDALAHMMAPQLSDTDRAPLLSGAVRWIIRVRFARNRLRMHGLLVSPSAPGIWALTPAGKRYADSDNPRLPPPVPPDDPNQLALMF